MLRIMSKKKFESCINYVFSECLIYRRFCSKCLCI